MNPEPQNINDVLLELQSQRPVLAKTRTGQVGNQKTRYADLVQVNDVVLKLLNDMQTTWVCRPHLEAGVFGLHYSLRHVPSDTEISGVWPLGSSDNPQKLGSAVTYGRRYALLAVTGIVAEDEDDDGAAAAGERSVQRAPQQRRQTPRTAESASEARPTVQRAPRPPLPSETTDPNAAERRRMHTLLTNLGMNEDQRRDWIVTQVGHPVGSTKELTGAELTALIDKADEKLAAQDMGGNSEPTT